MTAKYNIDTVPQEKRWLKMVLLASNGQIKKILVLENLLLYAFTKSRKYFEVFYPSTFKSVKDEKIVMKTLCVCSGRLNNLTISIMFIASKYEDYYPIKMKIVYEKIAH